MDLKAIANQLPVRKWVGEINCSLRPSHFMLV